MSGLGVGTDGLTEGQKSKMKPRQSTSILTPTDGRTAHMSGSREERREATCRQGGGSFVVRGEQRSGGSRSYTELMKPRVWFASIHRFPPEVEHESFVLKMGLLRL